METKNYFSTDAAGNILPSATCYLYIPGTTDLATGITNINGAPLANPFVAATSGLVQFKAPDGEYDLRVVGSGREFTIRIQCFDGVAFIENINGIVDDALQENVSTLSAPHKIPRGDAGGKIDMGWLPEGLATKEDIDKVADSAFEAGENSEKALAAAADVLLDVDRRSRQALTQMPTFRKKVKANLPLITANYQSQKAVQSSFNGSTTEFYPQGFCVDWERRELFILRKGSIVLIEVYDWDTLVFKTSFFTKTDANTFTTASSEQPVIIKVDGRRKLFTKGITRQITRFDIEVLPDNLGAVIMDASWNVNVYTSFAYKNGIWLVEDASYPVMVGVYRKTRYIKYDSEFNRVGEAEIGAHIAGLDDALTDSSSRAPKKQGMCIAMGGIFFGVGGRRAGTDDVYDYRHQGVRFLNGSGDVMLDSTVRHSDALAILKNNGVVCEFIENEGVQVDDNLGNVYGLYSCLDESSPGADKAGILLLQEFCADADAIDFTKAAALNTFHNTRLMSGLAAKSTGGNYYNPVSGAQFTGWSQICKYMLETDREIYAFDSSVSSLKLPDGTNTDSGLKLKIDNYNGKTFFVQGTGLYQDRKWRFVWDDSGDHLLLEYEPRVYKNKLPFADATLNVGQSDFRWNTGFFLNGITSTSDAREKTAPLPIGDKVLDAWGDVQFICFQWLSSIMREGADAARWHFGVVAQQVRDAFAARGLDGTRYGLLCYDEWPESPETRDEDGAVIEQAREAGNRWGIRSNECLFLEAAYQRRRADRSDALISSMGDRISKLEAK